MKENRSENREGEILTRLCYKFCKGRININSKNKEVCKLFFVSGFSILRNFHVFLHHQWTQIP